MLLIKIGTPENPGTSEEIEYWRDMFKSGKATAEHINLMSNGRVTAEEIDYELTSDSYVTVVKVGNQNNRPTTHDLDAWREIFEEAKLDKNFQIFTHEAVTIKSYPINDMIVIGSDFQVVKKDSK